MTSVSDALRDLTRERNELREQVRRLQISLDLALLQRKQWEAWAMGSQQNALELRDRVV